MNAATEALLRRDSILILWELRALWIATFLYFAASFCYLTWLIIPSPPRSIKATRILLGALVVHTSALVFRSVSSGRMPLQTPYEELLLFGWVVAVAYALVEGRFRGISIAGFPAAMLAGFACAWALIGHDPGIAPGGLELWNRMFMLHIATVSLSCAILAVAFCVELGYLLVARVLPPQTLLRYGMDADTTARFHRAAHQLVLLGFPVLGIGIITGLSWTHRAWGNYWLWSPGQTWSLITWLLYALYVHSMTMSRWRGGRASALNSLGFAGVLMTVFAADRLVGIVSAAGFLSH